LTARWTQVLASDLATPTTLYAGTRNGIFKSTTGGTTWTSSCHGFVASGVNVLMVDPLVPTTLYAAHEGPSKSTDNGATWSPLDIGAELPSLLAIAPTTPATLYVSVFDRPYNSGTMSILKSVDGGATWVPSIRLQISSFIGSLAVDSKNPATLYLAIIPPDDHRTELLQSTDGGITWGTVSRGFCTSTLPRSIAVDPQTVTTLYADCIGVLRSTDGGVTWSAMNNGLPSDLVQSFAVVPTTPTTLYVGDSNGEAFKSTNGGEGWQKLGLKLPELQVVSAFVVDLTHPSTVYAGTRGSGVLKSADGGATWTPMNDGLTNVDVLSLAIDPLESFSMQEHRVKECSIFRRRSAR